MRLYFGSLAGIAAVAILAAGAFWALCGDEKGLPPLVTTSSEEKRPETDNSSAKTVKRVEWTPDAAFAEYLSRLGEPIILKNSIAATFPRDVLLKLHRSDLDGPLQGFFKHISSYFGPYYDDRRPFHTIPAVAGRVPYDVDVTIQKSDVERILNGQSPPYYHLSADPANFGMEFNTTEMLSLFPQESSENVWISMKGVVTPCHYDGYHNMYTQLSGSKTFVLLPPCEY